MTSGHLDPWQTTQHIASYSRRRHTMDDVTHYSRAHLTTLLRPPHSPHLSNSLTPWLLLCCPMSQILSLLVVDTESVERNLRLLGGKQLSERIMIACAHKLGRQTAHEILRQYAPRPDFVAALESDERIASAMSQS